MGVSDKISWVGGMMGLFTGFSVISGFEILYWIWFKVVFHKKDVQVAPEPEKTQDKNAPGMDDLSQKIDQLKNDLDEIRSRMKSSEDPKAGLFFDAIFNDIEAQQKADQEETKSSD